MSNLNVETAAELIHPDPERNHAVGEAGVVGSWHIDNVRVRHCSGDDKIRVEFDGLTVFLGMDAAATLGHALIAEVMMTEPGAYSAWLSARSES